MQDACIKHPMWMRLYLAPASGTAEKPRTPAVEVLAELLGWFATENDKVPTAIDLIRREWQRLARGDNDVADTDDAKAFLKGALPLALDGTATMAERLLTVQRLGQPPHEPGHPHLRDRGGPQGPGMRPWSRRA
jgi:hypothetical protein